MTEQNNPLMLQQLQQQGLITEQQYQTAAQAPRTVWWLEVLTALAAWIASLFVLSVFGGTLLIFGDSISVHLAGGIILLAGCAFMARQPQDFLQQMAVAFSLAGQALILWAVNDTGLLTDAQLYLLALVQAAALLFLPLNIAHRWLCSIIILISLHLLLSSMLLIVAVSLLLTGVVIMLWLSRTVWAAHPLSPLIKSVTEILTLYSLLAASVSQDYFSARYSSWWMDYHPYIPSIYQYGSMLLLFGCVCWLSRHQPIIWRLVAAAVAIILMLLLQNAPGMLLSTSLLLATFYGCSKRWFWASLLFMLIYLSEFYYSLHITLLQKSGVLLLSGMFLLLLFGLLNYYQRRVLCHPR